MPDTVTTASALEHPSLSPEDQAWIDEQWRELDLPKWTRRFTQHAKISPQEFLRRICALFDEVGPDEPGDDDASSRIAELEAELAKLRAVECKALEQAAYIQTHGLTEFEMARKDAEIATLREQTTPRRFEDVLPKPHEYCLVWEPKDGRWHFTQAPKRPNPEWYRGNDWVWLAMPPAPKEKPETCRHCDGAVDDEGYCYCMMDPPAPESPWIPPTP